MMASSAALSTSVTKSLCCFLVTLSKDTSKDARLMMEAPRRAALIAVLSIGGISILKVPLKWRLRRRFRYRREKLHNNEINERCTVRNCQFVIKLRLVSLFSADLRGFRACEYRYFK